MYMKNQNFTDGLAVFENIKKAKKQSCYRRLRNVTAVPEKFKTRTDF